MPCGCPSGYTYNTTTGMCERLISSDAILNTAPLAPPLISPSIRNMVNGTVVYAAIATTQFPLTYTSVLESSFIDGNGLTLSPISNIITGDLWISLGQTDKGRLNQAGIGLFPNDLQGFVRSVTIKEGEQVSVALSATNGFKFYVDGVLAVDHVPLLPVKASDYLYIFPLSLPVGTYTLLFEAYGVTEVLDTTGGFVCEVYKGVTPQILSEITTVEELFDYFAKDSVNGIGSYITSALWKGSSTDTGKKGNYKCTTGSLNVTVEGKILCQYTDIVAPGACCFNLTNCATGAVLVTDSDLSTYLNKTVKLFELGTGDPVAGCHIITVNPTAGACDDVDIQVGVEAYYDDCTDCQKVYYKLMDCTGTARAIVTDTNLSSYVGKIVKIEGYNVCWIVVIDSPAAVIRSVNVIENFNTCQDCS